MKILLRSFWALILCCAFAHAQEEEPIFSGPQKGERLMPFTTVGVYDELAGKELDFVGEAGDRPMLLVFIHDLTRPSFKLTRILTDFLATHTKDASGRERLVTRLVWLQDDRSAALEYLDKTRASLQFPAPLGVSVDGAEGPGTYGLNRNVILTILVANKGRVTANFALDQPSDTDATDILAEVVGFLGLEQPTWDELARYGPRRGMGRSGGGRDGGMDGGRGTNPLMRPAPEPTPPMNTTPAEIIEPAGPFDERASALEDLVVAVGRAREKNRRVLILWGSNTCERALVLDELFVSDRALARTLLYEYDLVRIDVGMFERHMDLATQLGADLEQHGLPFLTVLAAAGTPLVNEAMTPYELAGEGDLGHDPARLLQLLIEQRAPARDAEQHLAAGLTTAAEKDRHLFLVCGAPWSEGSGHFESWMRRREVSSVLGKHLVTLGIDVERDRGGQALMRRLRDQAAGELPWFAILDGDGKLFAHAGELSYPATDAEIASFLNVLSRVCERVTSEDLGVLRASLVEHGSSLSLAPGTDTPDYVKLEPIDYPDEMRQLGIEGTVSVGFEVGDDGKISRAWLIDSSGTDALDRAALEQVKAWSFDAAAIDAQGRGRRFRQDVEFRLR